MKKSKKNSPISLTKIRNLLKEIPWNPKTPGPMAIISDVGSVEFYEHRAIEEIRAAQVLRNEYLTERVGEDDVYHQHINKAIQLLLLARLSV